MVKQMLFLDAPAHTPVCAGWLRRRSLPPGWSSCARTSARSSSRLLDDIETDGQRGHDRGFRRAAAGDRHRRDARRSGQRLATAKDWSANFAEMLGNFQHNPDRAAADVADRRGDDLLLPRSAFANIAAHPREGLIHVAHDRPRSTATA